MGGLASRRSWHRKRKRRRNQSFESWPRRRGMRELASAPVEAAAWTRERGRGMTLEGRGTKTGRGRGTLRELRLRGEASWRRKGRETSLSRLRWACLKRRTTLGRECLMRGCSTSPKAWILASATMRCTEARRTWKRSRPTRGLWPTRVSREQRVALLEAVPELVPSSSRRRRTIRLVWMPSCTRLSRQAATRGRTTMKKDWDTAALTVISSNAMWQHRLHHKLPCRFKLGKCQSCTPCVKGRYLDFLFS